MRIDIVLRSDWKTKPGGDVVQIARMVEHLPKNLDVRVDAATVSWRPRPKAVVHLVNLDRPYDLLLTVKAASGRRIVFSPIFHPRRALTAMRAQRRHGLRTYAERLLPDHAVDLASYVIRQRSAQGITPAAAASSRALHTRLTSTINNEIRTLIFLAEGERAEFLAHYSVTRPTSVVIPNGLGELPAATTGDYQTRQIDVLVPGRIETRKNQLEAALLLSQTSLRCEFVGAPNARDRQYVRAFKEVVSSSSNLRWVSGVAPSEMPSLYQASKLVLNPSHVEVLSLVDLEAIGLGCNLVTTAAGHTREWVGDLARYFEPGRLNEAVSEIQTLIRMPPSAIPREVRERLSWQRVATATARVYEEAASD